MIPLSAVLAKVARDHFDLDVPDAGTRLGSPQIIKDMLTAAGYTDIQGCCRFRARPCRAPQHCAGTDWTWPELASCRHVQSECDTHVIFSLSLSRRHPIRLIRIAEARSLLCQVYS